MKRRLGILFGLVFAAMLGFLAAAGFGAAQTVVSRVPFVIATGPTGGTYFPIGKAIAGIISHPPGVARCETADVCGPMGLVASVRTSPGAVANVLDVNAGRADAALAQSDVISEALAGHGAFRKLGPQRHILTVAGLFPEEVHVVAATGSHIAALADLRGKRVGLGAPDSGTFDVARAVLAAFRVPLSRLKASNDPAEVAAARLDRGDLDAFFFVGGAPVTLIESLVARGKAVLVPIDGAGRKRLIASEPGVFQDTILAEEYPGSRMSVETAGVRAVLIVNDNASDALVYGIVKALFHPANRETLDDSHPSARFIRIGTAAQNLPAPLHPGAKRFYREMGVKFDAATIGSAASSRGL